MTPPENTTEPSMCGGDAALCQITLTTCYHYYTIWNQIFAFKFLPTGGQLNLPH